MKRILSLFALALILSACTPAVTPVTPTRPFAELTPYATHTLPAASSTPLQLGTPTPLPSPSPTPRIHTIKLGESFSSLALTFGVSVEQIQAANPKASSNLLKVGDTLIIPASTKTTTAANSIPSATPVALQLKRVHCLSGADGGAWCFVLFSNTQPFAVESVSARFRLVDSGGQNLTMDAATTLNHIVAGSSFPLAAYFKAPLLLPVQASVEILSALPVDEKSGRYLPIGVEQVKTQISADGLSAVLSGKVTLPNGTNAAKSIWVAAIAYNAAGDVIGLRRWQAATGLKSGQQLDFSFSIYSMSGTIHQVDLIAEGF